MSVSRPGDIFSPGDLLNNTYRIEAILGRGGTSEVYRARNENSGRVVALKALRSELSRNEDYMVLMRREEEIREVRHDVIVRYYDIQRTDDGRVYLVMDFVDGPGLDQKLRAGGMSAADLLVVGARVAEGLEAAHAKNIVHRDLSPDNIILGNGDPAKAIIIDFGIAKDSNPGAETIVGSEFAGKYAYAAPEQLGGHSDARSDIYALGALLLATFRGKKPDVGGNPMEVVRRKALPLDTSDVPEPLKSVLDRMTDPDPSRRFQSASDVLAAFRGGDPAPTTEVDDRTVIAPRPTVVPPSAARQAPASPMTGPTPKRGGLFAALAVLVLAGLGAGAYWAGFFPGLTTPALVVADPFTFLAERKPDGRLTAVGYVPSVKTEQSVTDLINKQGGAAELTLARGNIVDGWGEAITGLLGTVSALPEWRLLVNGNQVGVTGLTDDPAQQHQISTALRTGMPAGLTGSADIQLGPRILPAARLMPLLSAHADCGALSLVNPPPLGYPMDGRVVVSGRVADMRTRVALSDAISAIAGSRSVDVEAEVLNPTLCLVDAALPTAPPGGFEVILGYGDRPDLNRTGRYFVGENPVIDIEIPADVTTGYLFVSALDVSGNVFHLLPNLTHMDNSIASLRAGATGPVRVRVAFPLSQADNGKNLAFLVDDTSLGKTKIIVILAQDRIFDELRPTTESAEGFVKALRDSTVPVTSIDSRILVTAKP